MNRVSAWLERRWYGDAAPGAVLRALEGGFAAAVAVRRLAYARGWTKSHRVAAPVIVVGNLGVGGTGKTPLTIALVQWLQQRGWSPGVVSRGYGRRSRRLVHVGPDTPVWQGGDEPCLIAARTGAVVVVDRDRVAAAEAAIASGCDIILSDDGLQHYRLARDLEIELLDGDRGYGNRRMLPAGPLREPPERGQLCDAQVVNGGDGASAGQWPMRLEAGPVRPLHAGPVLDRRCLSDFSGQRVHAVAGIGNPARFFAMLEREGIEVIPHPFPDHHPFVPEDLAFEPSLPVLMTEKDAVKCPDPLTATGEVWVVPVNARLPDAFYALLAGQLTRFDAGAGAGAP